MLFGAGNSPTFWRNNMKLKVKPQTTVNNDVNNLPVGTFFMDEAGDVMVVAKYDGKKVLVSFENGGVFVYDDVQRHKCVKVLKPNEIEIIQ